MWRFFKELAERLLSSPDYKSLLLEGHQWRQLSPDCRLRLSLFVLFATGLLFLTIPLNFFHELGHAFLIAAVLGWLVDKSLKTKLVRDAFEAAYGYVLAPELKQEIHRVMNYRFLCVECNIVIDIDDVFDLKGFIKVTARFERVIKNITRDTQFFPGWIDVDEWNAPNFSSCLERYAINGQECYPDHLEREVTTCPPKLVFNLKEKLPVAAEDQINVVGAYSEARPRNGEFSLAWLTPTIDPTVTIRLPQGFLSSVSFGVPGEVISSSKIANSHTLKGAQFPGQEITVRWWPITN